MVYFLDTSGLAKRYATEVGSNWITTITDPFSGNQLLIAKITIVEVHSALAKKAREGKLSPSDLSNAVQAFRDDYFMFKMVEINSAIIETASRLTLNHKLRAYDAVQLAAALYVDSELKRFGSMALSFISADRDLLIAARAENLNADDPTSHS